MENYCTVQLSSTVEKMEKNKREDGEEGGKGFFGGLDGLDGKEILMITTRYERDSSQGRHGQAPSTRTQVATFLQLLHLCWKANKTINLPITRMGDESASMATWEIQVLL